MAWEEGQIKERNQLSRLPGKGFSFQLLSPFFMWQTIKHLQNAGQHFRVPSILILWQLEQERTLVSFCLDCGLLLISTLSLSSSFLPQNQSNPLLVIYSPLLFSGKRWSL